MSAPSEEELTLRLKLFLIATVISSSTSFAADLQSRSLPPVFTPPPIPLFSWTGLYAGGQVGYEFGHDSVFAPGLFPVVGYNPKGVIGGAHFGYNQQVDRFVYGLEADVNGSGYAASVANPLGPIVGAIVGSRIPVDGSIRARVGVSFDRALFYATGGAAFASIKDTYFAPASGQTPVSRSRVGYTVGAGIDYAVTPNWSAGVEYRYTDYGQFGDLPGIVVVARVHRETDNRVQARLGYKFDLLAPATPVVARY